MKKYISLILIMFCCALTGAWAQSPQKEDIRQVESNSTLDSQMSTQDVPVSNYSSGAEMEKALLLKDVRTLGYFLANTTDPEEIQKNFEPVNNESGSSLDEASAVRTTAPKDNVVNPTSAVRKMILFIFKHL